MSFPSSREPRMVQVPAWRLGKHGKLERCVEWRDERFLELDRLIAAERPYAKPREPQQARVCPVEGCGRPRRSGRGGYCWLHRAMEGDSQ